MRTSPFRRLLRRLLRRLSVSLLVGCGLPSTSFAESPDYFTGPETEWNHASLDAAPSATQVLTADRTLRSLKLDAGVGIYSDSFALTLTSGALLTTGDEIIAISGGTFGTGGTTALRIQTDNTNETHLGTTLVGSGGLIKTGEGTLILSGYDTNTLTGDTIVNAGTLALSKDHDGINSISGDLMIGDGQGIDTVRLHIPEQIPDTATVTLHGGGVGDAANVARLEFRWDADDAYYYYSGSEIFAALVVAGNGVLDFSDGTDYAPNVLRLDSLVIPPGSRLTVKNWTPDADYLLVKTAGIDPDALSRLVMEGSPLSVSIIPYGTDYVLLAPLPVITFPAIPDPADGDAPLVLSATVNAGGFVRYEVVSGFATVLEDGRLRLDYPGEVTVRAWQPSHGQMLAAAPVERTFTILPGARPANDDFANAALLAGDSGTVAPTNLLATGEALEPDFTSHSPSARSLWWSWTAPADGYASFDNKGSVSASALDVFTGADFASLDRIATGYYSIYEPAVAVFSVTAGTTYHIRLRGFKNTPGELRLNWTFLTTPVLKPATRITSQGFTASWSGGARAYRLEIFDSHDYQLRLRFAIPVAGATTYAVRGLDSGAIYSFRVVATDGADLDLPSEILSIYTPPSATSAPENDSVADAIVLVPSGDDELGGSIAGDNRHATNELYESTIPLANVWYRWTPPATGLWRLKLTAAFPATLALYPDTELADVAPLASAKTPAALDWETRADAPFLIQVAGEDAAQGTFTLTWELVRADELPANDNFADAAPLPEFPETVTGSNRHATVEENELDPAASSLWWRWTAPLDGMAAVGKTSDFASRLFVFEATELEERGYHPADSFTGDPSFKVRAGETYYLRIDGQQPAPLGTVSLGLRFVPRPLLAPATDISETGFTVSWTHVEGPRVLRIYDYLDPYNGNDNAYVSPVQTIRLPAGVDSYAVTSLRPGTDHYYTIATTDGLEQRSALGAATTLPPAAEPPANDLFGEPVVLSPDGGSLTINNRYASNESGEADDDDEISADRASLWYIWTTPATGEWSFSLAGSTVPAAIEIRGGESHFYSSPILTATGSPADGDAECAFVARAGETFRIVLLGVGETRGDLALSWSLVQPLSPPANDTFENAQLIEGSSGATPVPLDLASADDAGPYPTWMPSVWLRWQAPATENIRFTLSSTDDDASLSLYTGESLDTLNEVYSLNGFGSDGSFSQDWSVQAGVVYHLRIQGYDRLRTDTTLAWSPSPPPSPAPIVVTRGARFVTLRLPLRARSELYRELIVSTRADLSEPLHRIGLMDDAGDYVVTGLLPSTRYYYQLHDGSYYQPDASVFAIGTVDTAPDKSAPPANDYAHPTKIPAKGGSVKGTTKNASGSSVWYAFTPATSGFWKVRVSATDHYSYFAVLRAPTPTDPNAGPVLAPFSDIYTSQRFEPAKTVERLAPLRAGVTYLVEVIDAPGGSGAFTLSLAFAGPLAPPANDDFAAATVITGRTGSATGDLSLATRQPEELGDHLTTTGYSAAEHTIWWRWTAPHSGRVRFAFGGSPSYSRDIAVFTGDSLATLQGLAHNAYSPGNEKFVIIDAVAGTTYHIRAGTYQPPGGIDTLTWGAVGPLEQTIRFPEVLTPVSGPTTIQLSATASSGLPVAYRILYDGPATIEGNMLHFIGPGTVAVIASQPGDDFYAPAQPVINYIASPLPVAGQSIWFPWPGDRYVGSAPGQLLASADSGLPVEFAIVSGPATVAGNLLTVTGPGKVVIRATQPGEGALPAAPPIEHTFTVLQAPTIPAIALARVTRVYNGLPQSVIATTRAAGLTATYTYKPAKGPTTSTPPTDAGTYTVTATLDDPARSKATGTLVIAKAPLVATAPELTRLVGEPNPAPLAITYRGFVNGENATVLDRPPVAATKAHARSNVGVYPITLSGGADNNYALTYAPGRLVVLGFAGSYEALLFDARSVALGKLELTVSANALAFTGTLTLAGEIDPITIRGSLAATKSPLAATGAWNRSTAGATSLALTFQLAGDMLSGSLRVGEEHVLSIPANNRARLYIPATKTAPPWSGAHTFLLRDPVVLEETDERPLPRGAGHATATIASTGALTLKGRLADGTPLTASARLDVGFRYRLLVKPYAKRADSFLSGPLVLTPHPDEIRFPGRVHAAADANPLAWAKAALPETTKPSAQDKTYRAGFAVDALASLDPWLPPASAQKATKTTPARPAITLAQRLGLPTEVNNEGEDTGLAPFTIAYDENVYLGEMGYEVPTEAMLALNNRVSVAENPRRWTLTINPATGAFSGGFVLADPVDASTEDDPYATKSFPRKVAFTGVLRQVDDPDAPVGQGFFLLDPLPDSDSTEQVSGEIRLVAPDAL